jgi:cytoskeletal protein CcmA (bactofilin family)
LRKSAVLVGNISTQRIIIEDGAYFKGGIDVSKETKRTQTSSASATASTTSTPVTAVTTPPGAAPLGK